MLQIPLELAVVRAHERLRFGHQNRKFLLCLGPKQLARMPFITDLSRSLLSSALTTRGSVHLGRAVELLETLAWRILNVFHRFRLRTHLAFRPLFRQLDLHVEGLSDLRVGRQLVMLPRLHCPSLIRRAATISTRRSLRWCASEPPSSHGQSKTTATVGWLGSASCTLCTEWATSSGSAPRLLSLAQQFLTSPPGLLTRYFIVWYTAFCSVVIVESAAPSNHGLDLPRCSPS